MIMLSKCVSHARNVSVTSANQARAFETEVVEYGDVFLNDCTGVSKVGMIAPVLSGVHHVHTFAVLVLFFDYEVPADAVLGGVSMIRSLFNSSRRTSEQEQPHRNEVNKGNKTNCLRDQTPNTD